jgi:CRISPR-associated protein Csm4
MKITKLYPPQNNGFVMDELPFKAQTLFGALANCYVSLFGGENFIEFLKYFENGKIGSIFPAIRVNEKEIFFLPKPYIAKIPTNKENGNDISKKKIKKIRWLSFAAMKLLSDSIQNIDGEFYHSIDFMNDLITVGNEFLITKDDLEAVTISKLQDLNFYKHNETIRVHVARFGEDSTPFDQKEISFLNTKISLENNESLDIQTFLYFPEDIAEDNNWEATKNLFAEEGIGGKRNLGKGYFEKIVSAEIVWGKPIEPKLYLLLSNLIPQKEELKNIINYDTGFDDGFITFGYASTFKKDALFYLKEGSIINSEIEGKIVPQEFKENKIYRYGKALLLPI